LTKKHAISDVSHSSYSGSLFSVRIKIEKHLLFLLNANVMI